MNRRKFNTGVVASTLVAISRSQAQPMTDVSSDWQPFIELERLFLSLEQSTNPLAEFLDAFRLRSFLSGLQPLFSKLLDAKYVVLNDLLAADCSQNSAARMSAAQGDAEAIIPLLSTLADKTDELEAAVKPGGIQSQVREISSEMRDLRVRRKLWVDRVPSYCVGSARDASLTAEIQASIVIVKKCQDALDGLITKLQAHAGADHG